MVLHNEPQMSYYFQHLEMQKKRLLAARARKGETPSDRKPQKLLTLEHMMDYQDHLDHQSSPDQSYTRTTMIGDPYLPSTASIKDLRKTMIAKLTLETNHRGYYLLLKLPLPAVRMTAIISLAVDEAGDAIKFSLYQQEPEHVAQASEILKQNSVLLLKEPYFKCIGNGGYGLRVDHPSDILWLSDDDPLVPAAWQMNKNRRSKTAEEWKQEGNTAMNTGKIRDAIERYTAALKCPVSPEEAELIHNNRALAYLRLDRFDAVLDDVSIIPNANDRSEKALYRGALALNNLSRYTESLELLQILTRKYPASEPGAFELSRANLRLKEQHTGIYDFKKMYKATRSRPPTVDCATYVGSVEIRDAPGKGKGVFATRSIKAGELLLCEKAFVHACGTPSKKSDKKGTSETGILMNLSTNSITMGTQASLITSMYQKLLNNPSLASKIQGLHHGTYKPTDMATVDGLPVVDSFLIEKVVVLNAFGCALASKDVDQTAADSRECSGIWIQASYINHSCMANCTRNFIGDMIIVRATKDITADTELGFWYVDITNRDKVQDLLYSNWGFRCTCTICQDDLKTPQAVKVKRKQQNAAIIKNFSKNGMQQLEKTYMSRARKTPRLELAQLYVAVARQARIVGDSKTMISSALSSLEALGFVLEGVDMKRGTPKDGATKVQVGQWGFPLRELPCIWQILWTAWSINFPRVSESVLGIWKDSYIMVRAGEGDTFEDMYSLTDSAAAFAAMRIDPKIEVEKKTKELKGAASG